MIYTFSRTIFLSFYDDANCLSFIYATEKMAGTSHKAKQDGPVGSSHDDL